MAITSSAGDGIRITTAAKESFGGAAVLGSPASSASNNIIVPDAITANNEGNLTGSPSYVGRLICIRPWEVKLSSVEIKSGGGSYTVNDVLTLAGGVAGASSAGKPQVTVEAVSGGVITELSISRAESFELRTVINTGGPSPGTPPFSTTGGTGSGAVLVCRFEPHFEIRYITADSSNTLTVHEDWDVPPVSGGEWALAYTLDDVATVNGLTLTAKSGVFEATRTISVGTSAGATRKGFLGWNDGKALELDNVSGLNNGALLVDNDGVLQCGYLSSGIGVNGGYVSTSGTSTPPGPEISVNTDGGIGRYYDLQARSPRELMQFKNYTAATDNVHLYWDSAGISIQNTKWFKTGGLLRLSGRIRNCTIQRDVTDTGDSCGLNINTDGPDNWQDIDGLVVYGSKYVSGVGGALSSDGGFQNQSPVIDPVYIRALKNITWIEPEQIFRDDATTLQAKRFWQITNPQWNPDLSSANQDTDDFKLASRVDVEVWEMMSLIVNAVDSAGQSLTGVSGYVYEGLFNDNLPNEEFANNQGQTEAVDWNEFNDYVGGLVRHVTNVLNRAIYRWSTASGRAASEQRGLFAWRGYIYGYLPTTAVFTVDLNGGLSLQPVFLLDDALTKATASAALSLSPTPVLTKHGSDNPLTTASPIDPRRMIAFHYDNGNGASPPDRGDVVVGQSISPFPEGTVVDRIGDGVSGTLLLEFWNGYEWTDNLGIQHSFWVASVDRGQSPEFYEEYTWDVDAQANSANDLYDWLAAKMEQFPADDTFAEVIRWGGRDTDANQLMFSDGSAFFTNRATKTYPPLRNRLTLFSDDFQRSPLENPVTGVGSPQPWNTYSAGNDWETNLVSSEIVLRSPSIVSMAKALVNESAQAFSTDQWAKAAITDVSTLLGSGYTFYVHVRDDQNSATGGGYFARFGVTAGGDYQLSIGVYSGGVVEELNYLEITKVSPDDLVGVTVEIECLIVGYVVYGILWVDGEIYAQVQGEDTLQRIASGQPGVSNGGFSSTANGYRKFEAGDFGASTGQGVWISNRGTGAYSYFTSDSGQQYIVPATVTLSITTVDLDRSPVGIQFVEVRIEVRGTKTLIATGETDSSGNFSASYDYTTDVEVDIVIRRSSVLSPRAVRYLPERLPATISSNGITQTVRLTVDPNAPN